MSVSKGEWAHMILLVSTPDDFGDEDQFASTRRDLRGDEQFETEYWFGRLRATRIFRRGSRVSARAGPGINQQRFVVASGPPGE